MSQTFEPAFIEGMFDSIIAYLESCDCEEYTCNNRKGWRVSFQRRTKA
jgi:hypothetical protein